MEMARRSRSRLAIGAVLVLLLSVGLFYLVITGRTRKASITAVPSAFATSTDPAAEGTLVPRRLDGVLVPVGQEAFAPRAVMVENMVDARPLSGLSKANLAIESPVEGGITRFVLFFDATTTVEEVGPVRSARPYYIDWVIGWHGSYFHVGGSPEAMDKIRAASAFTNVDEMGAGRYFWRSDARYAPHNTYTKKALMDEAVLARGSSSSTAPVAWHFIDQASSTDRGDVRTINVAYGGSYNVSWKFDKERDVYVRWQGKKQQFDKDGSAVESDNVVVIKTDEQVLDDKGRLKVRTTGSGEAVAYRDGNKYVLHWRRSPGEPIRLESTDGTEFLFNRGTTWIEVTTDDSVFAGLGM